MPHIRPIRHVLEGFIEGSFMKGKRKKSPKQCSRDYCHYRRTAKSSIVAKAECSEQIRKQKGQKGGSEESVMVWNEN